MSRTITSRSVRRPLLATLATAATLTLVTACSSSTASPAAPPAPASSSTSAPSTAASTAATTSASSVTELKTATTSLGAIITDGKGMVLYMYTKDTQGAQGAQASACTGGCATAWPLALADAAPKLTDVTGTVTMIPTASGGKQLALNGWPLYYYAKDKAAGDTLGQGVGTVWYVLDATGTPKNA